jgi:DNA-binding transcriptional LysR family regulator
VLEAPWRAAEFKVLALGENSGHWLPGELLLDAEGLRQEIDLLGKDLSGTLTLGVIPTAMPFAARISSKLREKHPNIAIALHSMSTRQIDLQLNSYALDAGITYCDDASAEEAEPLYEERYVLIAPDSLVSGDARSMTWVDAAKIPLCLLTPNMQNRQFIDEVFAQVEAEPTVVMEASGFTGVLAQVASGHAATIAPGGVAETFLALNSTVQLDLIAPVVTHSVGLAIKDQSPMLPMVGALRDAIADVL